MKAQKETGTKKEILRMNPKRVPAPVGEYSHLTIIPRSSDIYAFSGQIGIDDNGNIPDEFNRQVKNTFDNIKGILDSQNLNSEHVIKVNIWSTEDIDWDYFNQEWKSLFGDSFPSMTVAYVSALGLPEIKVEIEIWAASVDTVG